MTTDCPRHQARPVLRELIHVAPTLLRATFEAWGYSRPYCLLEQLWLESYAGMVCSSLAPRQALGLRQEGLAMAVQLTAMLQGKVQMRVLRHQVDGSCAQGHLMATDGH